MLISQTPSDVSEPSAYVETDPFVFKDVTGLCGLRPASILADTDFKTDGKKPKEAGNYSLVGTHLSLSFATRTPQAKHGGIDLQTQH